MSPTATAAGRRGLANLEPVAADHQPAWLERLRRDAIAWIAEHGFPTQRDEDWKYTKVGPLLEVPFEVAPPPSGYLPSLSTIEAMAGDLGGIRLVFVNGHLTLELSSLVGLPDGVRMTSFASALVEDATLIESVLGRSSREYRHAFTALNDALTEDGVFIQVAPDTIVAAPIHLVFLSESGPSPLVSSPRSVVLVGTRSRATIVETYVGVGGGYLTNAVTEVVLEDEARVEHYKIQDEAADAYHLAALHVRPGRDSSFSTYLLALGAAIARHEVWVRLEAEGAEVTLNGLYLPKGDQQHDNPTFIEHVAPHCTSRQLYKGALGGHGRGVFNGRIVVGPDAAGTDASQTNKNLLLSSTAEVDTRPRLEIFTDDVRCTHGAAVGQLNEDAVFYLRSRGVPHHEARAMLTYAFAREMLELIAVGTLRSRVEGRVAERLRDAPVEAGQ